MTTSKLCPRCGQMKPPTLEYFFANKHNKDGLSVDCKICDCERVRDWRRCNRARVNYKSRVAYCRKKGGLPMPDEKAEQVEMFPAKRKKKKEACTCHDYQGCMECRNRERELADKENRIPAYLLGKIAPDVYQICLAVRATAERVTA